MTMIEVMVGIVLTSILVLALSGTWAMVSDEFFKLTLKQKAAFVLNGEMERLVAAFRYKNPAGDWLKPELSSSSRYVYDSGTIDIDNNDIKNIVVNTSMVASSFANSQIHFYTESGKDYNVVWLDRDRQITATLTWAMTESVGPTDNADCYWKDSGPKDVVTNLHCRLLVVYLKYPFRYQSDTSPIADVMGWTTEISLQTIVGGLK
ncbi:putative Prepilin-type N-terminal cleavage/methylation domain-containing protein [Gammaproteobacteria bacterium]